MLFDTCPLQARLNEIITSDVKNLLNNGTSELPWMVDGAGLPPNASRLLPKLVITLFSNYKYIPMAVWLCCNL